MRYVERENADCDLRTQGDLVVSLFLVSLPLGVNVVLFGVVDVRLEAVVSVLDWEEVVLVLVEPGLILPLEMSS